MNSNQKKTRNCIEPWRTVQFDAEGNITPCCSGTMRGYFGNANSDYFEPVERGLKPDLFVNEDYRKLRGSLLSGELMDACKYCRSVHEADITPEELRQKVINHLESQGIGTNGVDLTREYAFFECGGNITNKCNFSCVYCSHSGTNGHSGYYSAVMEKERFLKLIDLMCTKGLRIFNFCGIGELTTYSGWADLCRNLLEKYPQLKIRAISNFGKILSDAELEILAKFDLIHVSCDTLDESTYAWLRKGGRLPVLLDNVRRLRDKFTGDPMRDPKLAFNVTVTDAITDKLENLFRFAAENNMFVHLSALFVMEGSIASQSDCVKKVTDIPDTEILKVRENFYDLPRRMKAQNPLTNIWEYKYLYSRIMKKADALTFNRFVPKAEEVIYDSFCKAFPKNRNSYLRKFWLSFDESIKGIFINAGEKISFNLPCETGKIKYRTVCCNERVDGNWNLFVSDEKESMVGKEMTIFFEGLPGSCNSVLFEVLSYSPSAKTEGIQEIFIINEAENTAMTSLLARESFLSDDEENITRRLADSQEPIVIWCAGLKALQMLSNTSLGRANIKMIIDGDPKKKGQIFCGRTVQSPEDLGGFSGKIVIIHASSPERVEFQIRQMGITNEILII